MMTSKIREIAVFSFACFCEHNNQRNRFLYYYEYIYTVEPRFNEPLFNEVLHITNDILRPGQSYSKMYGIEPRYNEFLDITNII